MSVRTLEHGRFLEDFAPGDVLAHPWEVTIDEGMVALFAASFLDATPTYASAAFARALGFRARPIHPLLLLNLALSMSVHDVSERAVAHLAYLDVRFPNACFTGDTVVATSVVLAVGAASADRGVLHVRTMLEKEHVGIVCIFERKVLVRARGGAGATPTTPTTNAASMIGSSSDMLPAELRGVIAAPRRTHRFESASLSPGDVLLHAAGRTITEAEHVTLAWLTRNTHPLHSDERWCRDGGSFTGTRVVYGGLVFAWVASLASRDVCGRALWDMAFDHGAHPSPVAAGDTLYAATRILGIEPHGPDASRVSMRLVGTKNITPRELIAAGVDIFAPERGKPADARIREKVFEIDRIALVAKV